MPRSESARISANACRHPNGGQQAGVIGGGKVVVGDGLARGGADLRGEVSHAEGFVAAQLVDLAGLALGHQDRCGGMGVVHPRQRR